MSGNEIEFIIGFVIGLALFSHRAIRRAFWRWRVQALYTAYHGTFQDHVLEAQQRRGLPLHTIRLRNKFNRALESLKKVDPGTRWRPLA